MDPNRTPPTNKPPNGPQTYAPNRQSTPILKAEMSLVEKGEGAGALMAVMYQPPRNLGFQPPQI